MRVRVCLRDAPWPAHGAVRASPRPGRRMSEAFPVRARHFSCPGHEAAAWKTRPLGPRAIPASSHGPAGSPSRTRPAWPRGSRPRDAWAVPRTRRCLPSPRAGSLTSRLNGGSSAGQRGPQFKRLAVRAGGSGRRPAAGRAPASGPGRPRQGPRAARSGEASAPGVCVLRQTVP